MNFAVVGRRKRAAGEDKPALRLGFAHNTCDKGLGYEIPLARIRPTMHRTVTRAARISPASDGSLFATGGHNDKKNKQEDATDVEKTGT